MTSTTSLGERAYNAIADRIGDKMTDATIDRLDGALFRAECAALYYAERVAAVTGDAVGALGEKLHALGGALARVERRMHLRHRDAVTTYHAWAETTGRGTRTPDGLLVVAGRAR